MAELVALRPKMMVMKLKKQNIQNEKNISFKIISIT